MNKKQLLRFALGLAIGLMSLCSHPVSAQPECPVQDTSLELPVVAVIPLTQAVPEQVSPDGKAQGVFLTGEVSLTFAASGQRVFLSADTCGTAPLRTDDYAELTVSPGGGQWSQDFRNPARTVIESRTVTEISDLLIAGDNRLSLSLVDLTGPAYSSTAYYLIVAEDPSYTAKIATPVPATATLTPTSQPTRTAIPTLTPVVAAPAPVRKDTVKTDAAPPRLWIWIGVMVGVLLISAVIWVTRKGRQAPPGAVEIYDEDGQYRETVVLSRSRKATVTLGSSPQADIQLTGAGLAARIYTQQETSQPVMALYGPDGALTAELPLYHQESHQLGACRLVYKNYAEETALVIKGVSNA